MGDYTHITMNGEFTDYLGRLKSRAVTSIAMDIEGEFNLHVYGERFCLLQLSDGSEDVVVDPFTVSTELIKGLLENRSLLKITYDCASDRTLLAKAHGIVLNSILDLRPAAEILDFPKQDLTSVLGYALGVEQRGSKKRFQQYNWTRRPIEAEALGYALADVRHLFRLRDELFSRLAEAGQLDLFILENLKRQDRPPDVDKKPGLFRSGRYKRLRGPQKQLFQLAFDIRDRYAQQLDLPPNSVLSNDNLFSLVTGELPPGALRGSRRVPDEVVASMRQELDEAVATLR